MRRRTAFARTAAASAVVALALAVPGPSVARPLDHIVAGVGTTGPGDRLAIWGYDSLVAGGGGGAIIRHHLATTSIDVVLDCLVIGFVPQHTTYASGRGSDGKTYYIGVQDNTPPFSTLGPYDTVSIDTARGTGPCGAWFFNTVNWFPVSAGDFLIGP